MSVMIKMFYLGLIFAIWKYYIVTILLSVISIALLVKIIFDIKDILKNKENEGENKNETL